MVKNNYLRWILFLLLLVSIPLNNCKKEDPATVSILTTASVFNVAATSATCGGNISANGGAEVSARGVCWGSSSNPTISSTKTSDGTGVGQFVSSLTGLSAGTTYHIRAYATNSVGTAYGADISFTTLGVAPSCLTQPASNITTSGATLNGTVNANYLSTIITFEYGFTTTYGQTTTAIQSPVTGNNLTYASTDISGLTPGTLYHFRIKGVNSIGSVTGADLTFTTSGQTPSCVTQPATNISTTGATLNGEVNPNSVSSTISFEYGTTTGYGQTATATQSPLTGNSTVNVSKDISGLSPGTTYHYRVKTINSLGTVYGGDMFFVTLGLLPSAITLPASNVNTVNSTLNGSVNANYLSTVVTFEYGTTTSYGNTVAAIQSPVTSNIHAIASGGLSGLTPGTIYHYRLKAVNSLGTTYGNDIMFITLGQVPTVTVLSASNINTTTTLNGTVNSNYLSTIVTFEYGTTSNYGYNVTADQSPVTGNTTTAVSSAINNLVLGSTYHYRIKAVNSLGTTYSNDMVFSISISELLKNGLVACYLLNGNAIDESGNGLNGTVNGAVPTTDRFGNSNSAFSFSDNQDITVSQSQNQNLYPLSISLWYNLTLLPNGNPGSIFSKYVSASWNGYQIIAGDYNNVPNNGITEHNGIGVTPWYLRSYTDRIIGYYGEPPFLQQNISFNTWYHYVFVVDATGGKIYVNGQLIDSHSWTGTPGNCMNSFLWKIGGAYDNGWFNGKIDDVRLYNRVLTQLEITYLSSH